MKITDIHAREIFDSRGIPTIECEMTLDDGMTIVSCVPAGTSRGMHEAYEMRDGGERLFGMGVHNAVKVIEDVIAPILIDRQLDMVDMDTDMIELDNTDNKSKLGANSM